MCQVIMNAIEKNETGKWGGEVVWEVYDFKQWLESPLWEGGP